MRLKDDKTGSYQGDHRRPAVEVDLNGVTIHDMFNDDTDDLRWDAAWAPDVQRFYKKSYLQLQILVRGPQH